MSHHPGCTRSTDSGAIYGTCTCAEIDLRNHTEALNRYSDTVASRGPSEAELYAEIESLREELASKDTFIRQLGADSALLDWYDQDPQHRSLHFRYDMRWSMREKRYYTGWEPMFRDVQPDACENTPTLREALALERARRVKEQKP